MHVAVVGGGVAGLAAARALVGSGARVTLFEAANRLGGQVRTEVVDGFLVERGAEGLSPPTHDLEALFAELGLLECLVGQQTLDTLRLAPECRSLEPLPPGGAADLLGLNVEPLDRGRGIVTPRGGMLELVTALASNQADRLTNVLGEPVRSLTHAEGSWRITTQHRSDYAADAIVVAVPAGPACRLLAPLAAADVLAPLQRAPALSSVTVAVAFPRSAVQHSLRASGFIVPHTARSASGLRAVSFVSSKFPGRVPDDGWVLLRAFHRPGGGRPLEAPDAEWVQWTVEELRPVLGLSGPPKRSWVDRWPQALAVAVGKEYLQALQSGLDELPPVALAGAGVVGAGVAACLRSGGRAARRLVWLLGVTSARGPESL